LSTYITLHPVYLQKQFNFKVHGKRKIHFFYFTELKNISNHTTGILLLFILLAALIQSIDLPPSFLAAHE